MQAHLDNSSFSLAVELLIKFSGNSVHIVQDNSAECPYVTDNGKKITGFLQVASSILNGKHPTLLPENDEKKEFEKTLTVFKELQTLSKEGGSKFTGKLQKVNKDLLPVVFVDGNRLTVLDFVLYTILQPIVATWKDDQIVNLPNIVRHFDFIQHYPGILNQVASLALVEINKSLKAKPQTADEASLYESKDDKPKQAQGKQNQNKNESQKDNAETKEDNNNNNNNNNTKKDQPQTQKKEQKPKQAQKPDSTSAAESSKMDVSRLDIRIGKIVDVKKHDAAETLYVENIDLGEPTGPRQIVSGLVNFVPIEEMKDRMVVVLCNLKPANLRGVRSQGMVLAASNADHTAVEVLSPPQGAVVGERVVFDGFPGQPDAELNPKHKVLETLAPDLLTDDKLVATYKGVPFKTAAGVVTVKSLKHAHIK